MNYTISDDKFIKAINESKNIHQCLKLMGLSLRGASYKTFKLRCEKLEVTYSHFKSDSIRRQEINIEQIKNSCHHNISRQATLIELDLNPTTNTNIIWINTHIKQFKIDTKHWLGQGHLKNKNHNWSKKIPTSQILIEHSTYFQKFKFEKTTH